MKTGSLIGPFEGRVVDADTAQPVGDALVWCAWSFQRGLGNTAAEAVRTTHTRTDADGRYHVDPLRRFPQGLSTRLSKFTLVVYKKGYVAYRHDRVFNQPRRRSTFAQLNNAIRLSRWSPELSHAEHLLFVGVGAPLLKASRWEVAQAVAELSGKRVHQTLASPLAPSRLPDRGRKLLDASVLLSSDEVRAVTGYIGAFKEGRLVGERSAIYDTFHLRAVDRPERYDLALRLWRLSEDDLVAKYDEILSKLPGSKQTDEIADRSFDVQQGEILGLGFLDRTHSAVVLITCGKGQCSTIDHIRKLARRAVKNLRRLPSAEQEPSPPRPTKPKAGSTEEDEE